MDGEHTWIELKQDIVVTDDSAERIEAERAIKEGRTPPRSPVKSKAKVPEIKQPEQDLFADFFWMGTQIINHLWTEVYTQDPVQRAQDTYLHTNNIDVFWDPVI